MGFNKDDFFILNRNLEIKIDKNDYTSMSFGMIERISLNSLKFFYFVAKFGSVTLAAKEIICDAKCGQ
jgi:hypothetical protein